MSLVTDLYYYFKKVKPQLLVADFAMFFKINCRMFWLYPNLLQVLWVNGGHCDNDTVKLSYNILIELSVIVLQNRPQLHRGHTLYEAILQN